MGIERMKVAECETLQFECDDLDHDENIATRRAWFSCGSQEGNLKLAVACGWIEAKSRWICPNCADRIRLGNGHGRPQKRASTGV
jgi:hypothetical protein